jgi:hypothetical protein
MLYSLKGLSITPDLCISITRMKSTAIQSKSIVKEKGKIHIKLDKI